jgi:hypothetical protein
MTTISAQEVPMLRALPASLPRAGAIEIELAQGVLIFRVSQAVQEHIEGLLEKGRVAQLTSAEAQELEHYEEMDDYLSYLNRLMRNLAQAPLPSADQSAS